MASLLSYDCPCGAVYTDLAVRFEDWLIVGNPPEAEHRCDVCGRTNIVTPAGRVLRSTWDAAAR